MKSYILAIAITMFLSALYAFQNIGDVTVRFLVFEWIFPQGVWDVMIFACGAVLMWIFSIFSGVETKGKYKKIIKEKDEKITALEREKVTLLESLSSTRRNYSEQAAPTAAATEHTTAETPEAAD